jgi:hypothetical protein
VPRGAEIEGWLERSLAGDESAWVGLLGELWSRVDHRVARSRYMGQLRDSLDDRREVVTRVFARLRRNELRALRTFPAWRDAHPGKTFDDWLTIVVTNVIREYVAERLGDVDASGAGLKRLINTLAESLDAAGEVTRRPSFTNTVAAAELVAAARKCLPADQQLALAGWLAGADFSELAREHGWTNADAARLRVRAGLARLRRELRDGAPS